MKPSHLSAFSLIQSFISEHPPITLTHHHHHHPSICPSIHPSILLGCSDYIEWSANCEQAEVGKAIAAIQLIHEKRNEINCKYENFIKRIYSYTAQSREDIQLDFNQMELVRWARFLVSLKGSGYVSP